MIERPKDTQDTEEAELQERRREDGGQIPFRLGIDRLTPSVLVSLAERPNPLLVVEPGVWERLKDFRNQVEGVLDGNERVYGINTGFGFLADVAIDREKLRDLQVNLIRSHACGVGSLQPAEVVRGILILRAHTFALGHSGIRPETLELLLGFLRYDILPLVPSKGSVGASGDLAPLAHIALALMGEGEALYRGERRSLDLILTEVGLPALRPEAKEGLALINGTQFMAVIGCFALYEASILASTADISAALSLDAIRGTVAAFDPRIQAVRPHPGQGIVAGNFRRLFDGQDAIMASHEDCGKVQDPYSFRCIPQVHGASRDVMRHVSSVLETEINSVTDNPLIFANGDIVSGGNFHGQPVAFAMDYLALALAELGSIAERRIEKITNPHQSGLPPFATRDSGLNSGYMIPHVVAASLVSENKILCHPASVDSIPTSADKEDHVSMGPISARKAREIAENVRYILAIEFLSSAQGLDLLAPLRPSKPLQIVFEALRKLAPIMESDRSLHRDIDRVGNWIGRGGAIQVLRDVGIWIE